MSFHPDLARAARWLPRNPAGPWLSKLTRALTPAPREPVSSDGVSASWELLSSGQRARIFRPTAATAPMPVLLWIHGGGHVIGTAALDDRIAKALAVGVGATVISPSYRLSPAHPYPAALDDLFVALSWTREHAQRLGLRLDRLIIAGASAGGGLAAALTIRATEAGVPVHRQHLVYPMLDDRTALKTVDTRLHRLWSSRSNHYGWRSYLNQEPGAADVPYLAAPARVPSMTGLPPAWIGVGTLDLFHDEDVAYAKRLEAAGVPVELDVIPGAFHGFDAVLSNTSVAKDFFERQLRSLRRAL